MSVSLALRNWIWRIAFGLMILFAMQGLPAQQGVWQARTLSNGLSVRYCEDSTRQMLHLGLTLRGGASLDREGSMGLGHLFEHLFFQYLPDSTPAYEASDKGILLAHNTSLESHFFGISITNDQLETALQLFLTGLWEDQWDDSTLSAAKAAIAGELQTRDNAPENNFRDEMLTTLWKKAAFQKHISGSYGNILRIAAHGLLEALGPYRHPANCLVNATSAAPSETFFASAERLLGSWHPESAGGILPDLAYPKLEKSIYFTSINEFASQPLVLMAWPVANAEDQALLHRNANFFCQMAQLHQSGFYKKLVEGNLAISYSWTWAGGLNPGQLLLYLLPNPDSIPQCMQAVQNELARLGTDGGILKEDISVANRLIKLEKAISRDQSLSRLLAFGEEWLLEGEDSVEASATNLNLMRSFVRAQFQNKHHVAGLLLNSKLVAAIHPERNFHFSMPSIAIAASIGEPTNLNQVSNVDLPKDAKCNNPNVLRGYRIAFETDGV